MVSSMLIVVELSSCSSYSWHISAKICSRTRQSTAAADRIFSDVCSSGTTSVSEEC